ncbi:MAG: hypothetical protein A2X94_01750 [Bdellovibrionales bacterium GWB1_55_8]|nr:MAG: hypothetical protein A2X94_01750 [Bdellovibrionales bacterium GWB1_55_8]
MSSKRFGVAAIVIGSVLSVFSSYARAAEFVEEIERDFPLKSIGQLHVTNMRGDVSVQGWALDKIRIKARRKAIADTQEEAQKLFSTMDFRYRSIDGSDIELSAEYGRGLDIQARLKERESPRTGMEMIVFAPGNLKLKISTVDGKATAKSWSAPLEIRTAAGPIVVQRVKSQSVSLLCPSCLMKIENVKASIRCMGGTGKIELKEVRGGSVYAETSSGSIVMNTVIGEQLYVSSSGEITGKALDGRIEFHAQTAPVEINSSSGFLSGRTTSGAISAQMKRWKFSDKALIETDSGNISLRLPFAFSGDVDIWSLEGKTEVGFPVRKLEEAAVGPQPAERFYGRVRDGGELLKLYTKFGNIRVFRGETDASAARAE